MRRILGILLMLSLTVTLMAGTGKLYLKYGVINGAARQTAQEKNQFFLNSYPEGQKGLHILQFQTPITEELKTSLEEKGLKILDYIPENALVVWGNQVEIANVNSTNLHFKGLFQPAYRVEPKLMRQSLKKSSDKIKVVLNIQFYQIADDSVIEQMLAEAGANIISKGNSRWQKSYRIEVLENKLSFLAAIPGTKWIETFRKPVTYSKEMPIVAYKEGSDFDTFNQVSSDILNITPLWNSGYKGAGMLAAVADTGLDVGNISTIHADFAGRIYKTYALGRTNLWSDTNGHGTHVAGSVLGDGSHSSGNFKGMAYEAQLIFQSTIDSNGNLGGIPNDLNDLFLPPYNDGARIHTNSWGVPVANGGHTYDSQSQMVDQFVWDHKDMIITIAAGNDGTDANNNGVIDLSSVSTPSTSKNCICVGATESDVNSTTTTWGAAWPSDFGTEPIKSDKISDNRNGMAGFSSRGPAPDGRIKPDVSAPGTMIISTRSQDSSAGTGWGVYDDWYVYMGGTSMATPITAGGSTVVRDYFVDHEGISPSAALVKATLANSAYDIYPGQYGTGSTQEIPTVRPNNVEGWGRVNIGNALMPSAPVTFKYVDEANGVSTNGTKTYTYSVSDSAYPLKITLAWSDYPSSTSASKNLVNDLDLTVTSPNGTVYYPNRGTSADRTNNMETVDISSPVTGDYTVIVKGYNVPNGPQAFAIAAHGAFGTVAPDTTPPVISTVSANPSYDSATITWTTDETATSVVNYGTTTSLGQTTSTSGYSVSHSVVISGLTAETTYYYQVVSADSSNNQSQGSILSFTTTAAPVLPTSFNDDMESGEGKWTKTAAGSTPWAITTSSYVNSGTHSFFSADEASLKDDIIATEEIDLTSASTASLTFYHTYKFENNYDGGVIEISTNGGSTFSDLGSKITSGGYTGTISTSYSSPIAGRSAWTGGTLGTMSQVTVDLASYVGNKVIVRFRLACDSSVGSTGWYVDDVAITSGGTNPAPTIDSFSANPTTITAGGSSTLSWTTSNATSCTINGSSVSVDGSMTVSPTTTTTYTLQATGAGGTVTQDVTVTVNAAAPTIDSFSANPTTITAGGSSTLSWTTSNATSCTINGSSVAVDGSMTVSPTSTTTYTLQATGSGGTVTQDVTVTVNAVIPPTIDSFSANPTSISSGSSSTLSWTTSNATSCTINGSSVSVDGSMTVSPTTTTTYTLQATGSGGTVTQDVTVTVTSSGNVDTRTFAASDVPKSIPDNNSTGVSSVMTLNDGYSIQSLSLSVDISHTYIGDLVVSLISPAGTEVIVSNRAGGSANDIVQTYSLTNFNGQDLVGNWTLKVKDLASRDTGTINSWSLQVKATYNSSTHVFNSTDTPISIPDNNSTGITSNLAVNGSATVTSFNVSVNITHTYIGDLTVTLYTPSGASTVLSNKEGGSANDIVKTYTVNAASGVAINGTWKLKVTDTAGYDVGTLNSWSLEFSY